MHKTSNKPQAQLQRIRPLTTEDAAALKKRLGKGSYNVTAIYTDGVNERVLNLFGVGEARIPQEYLACRSCGQNPVDTRVGEGSIWCRKCNEQWVTKAELLSGEEWPL